MIVSIIGVGFVGSAIRESFEKKLIDVIAYDKFKRIGNFESCLKSDLMFLCLPTLFDNEKKEYDKSSINEICEKLNDNNFNGIVIIKSTVEPNTIKQLSLKYKDLKFIHNPEFLSARTAFRDFHNQKHIVLGKTDNVTDEEMDSLKDFYSLHYPNAKISLCSSTESESMKIYCNSFYAVKIQFFNELYQTCNKNDCNFDTVRDLMLENNWINPMHTMVPGTDGKMSYGGGCFPKDTNALLHNMKKLDVPHKVLQACVEEHDQMRDED